MNDSVENNSLAQKLLETGFFDRHWYTAQSDRYFRSWHAAAQDYVEYGMAHGYSPHPLADLQHWPGHLREAWKQQKLTQVLAWFQRPLERQPKIGPLLVPSMLNTKSGVISSADVSNHPGGTLGWLVENAPEDYVVDYPEGQWTWGQVKNAQTAIVQTIKSHTYSTRTRMQTSWDDQAENSWKRRILDIQLDEVGNADTPLVSIIMPAWNRADIIAKAVRSVQRQTLSNWELIVIDDGSTDATRDVVKLLAGTDSRIRLEVGDHNGVCAARNLGLHGAKGRWVTFLDTDNQWPEDYLELSVKGATESNSRAVYSGLELHNSGKVLYRAYQGGLSELMILNHIDLNVLMVDRDLAIEIGGFDESLRRWVDHDLAIRIAKIEKPALLPFIGCRYWDERESSDRITTTESEAWQWVVLGKNLVDWDEKSRQPVIPGRVTVSMPVYQDWQMTVRAVNSVLENSGETDVEVIIVDNGSAITTSVVLGLLFEGHPRVKYVRLARNLNFAIGSNYGAFLGTGEYTCFLNNDTVVRDGWLAPMLERLQDPDVMACQPLLLYPDDSIQTAGTVFMKEDRLPGHFLANHPPEDGATAAEGKFPAITGACMLWRTQDIVANKGFDPYFVNGMEDIDLCLRALDGNHSYFAVEPASLVTHFESKTPGRGRHIVSNRQSFMDRWCGKLPAPNMELYVKAGFELAHVGGDQNLIPSPRPVVYRPAVSGKLRWGIRYAAIGGSRGDRWGDTHYVRSFADSLRSQGHEVVTYRHGHNAETNQNFDDINVVIRGLDKLNPIPGAFNVLWVISHPEEVTVEEIRAFDLVYASSIPWAQRMTELSGVTVRTLHQATDIRTFHLPDAGQEDRFRPATFVGGNTPNRERLVIADALTSGIDVRLVGHGWGPLVEPNMLEAEGIANDKLGEFYRSSKRVLADHWSDMAEQGFIQNRIFDAVACGTPVISDRVEGLHEVFGSMVQTYDSLDELRWLCSPEGDEAFGSAESRLEQARNVINEHSFDARARTMTADVERLR